MIKQQSAFTLIELAIVLIVVGILAGGGAKIGALWFKNHKIKKSTALQMRYVQSIEGFALSFGRLPTQQEFERLLPKTEDSWGKELVYRVDTQLSQKPLCAQNQTHIRFKHHNKEVPAIAFVLISSGANRNLQTALKSDGEELLIKSVQKGALFDENKADLIRQEAFDDLIVVRTLWELKAELGCKGAGRGY